MLKKRRKLQKTEKETQKVLRKKSPQLLAEGEGITGVSAGSGCRAFYDNVKYLALLHNQKKIHRQTEREREREETGANDREKPNKNVERIVPAACLPGSMSSLS